MSTQDWKQQYRVLLREHQQVEQIVDLLKGSVSQLSYLIEPGDEALDGRLNTLRTLLKKETVEREMLVTISNSLKADVTRNEAISVERIKSIKESFALLLKQLPSGGKTEKKQFEKLLKKDFSVLMAPALLKQYIDVQAASLVAGVTSEDKSAKDDAVADTAKEPEQRLMDEPPQSQAPVAFDAATCQRVSDLLSELLPQLKPRSEVASHYQQASALLDKGLDTGEIVISAVEHAMIVVISSLEEQKQEFHQFLEDITERLAEADKVIALSIEQQKIGFEDGRAMQSAVREHMQAIEQDVTVGDNLAQLKDRVAGKLSVMLGVLDKHQASESEREQLLERQLTDLQHQIAELEKKSQEAEKQVEEHKQLALRDALTQLPNHNAYDQRLQKDIAHWQSSGDPLVMVVSDIDLFKRINDTYGHQAGDKVLKLVAKSIRKRLRSTDFIARFGGEEFVVLMPNTTAEQALKAIDSIRVAIEKAPFRFNDEPVSITVSFGICQFTPGDNHEAVFERADQALYQAKEQGRNRCIVA